jgi:multiple sugar transport system permease protein
VARGALTQKQKDRRRYLLIYAGLTPFVFMAVFPIYWMLITAFKQDPDLYRMDNIPFWFNLAPTLNLFLPLSRVVAMLGLQDSWWALVVVYPTFTIPFGTWLLMGFFKTVPMEMEEAARVDGCGYLGAFLRIVLPVSVPGILTAVIFAFTLSMQDFLYGLAFVAPGDQKPVPVGVPTELIRGDVYYWGSLMGAALLVGLPVAILYNFFLDRFIQGITGGVGK